jgi:catalase
MAIRRSRTAFDAPVLDRSFGSMAEQRTTNASWVPVASDEYSLTVGPNGPTVLQDAYVVQKINRERVPERVVHAKGSAARIRPKERT